jgi:hypothetical protein
MTLALTEARFVRSHHCIRITIHVPGKEPDTVASVITGRVIGVMFSGGGVHHYRVSSADGVCYLAPPHWLPPHAKDSADWSITHDAWMFQQVWEAYLRDPALVLRVMAGMVEARPAITRSNRCLPVGCARGSTHMSTRRGFLALAANAAAAATVLPIGASAADDVQHGGTPSSGNNHPDIKLLMLCASFHEAGRTQHRISDEGGKANEDHDRWWARLTAAGHQWMTAMDAISATPATTPAGLAAKARALKEAITGPILRWPQIDNEPFPHERLAQSVADDILSGRARA